MLDLTDAHFWDITANDALDRDTQKLQRNGIKVELPGVNRAGTMVEKYVRQGQPSTAGH